MQNSFDETPEFIALQKSIRQKLDKCNGKMDSHKLAYYFCTIGFALLKGTGFSAKQAKEQIIEMAEYFEQVQESNR